MNSILTVATPAADLTLLTIAELRAAVGVVDGSKDAQLTPLGTRVAGMITAACRVVADGATPPTLRLESLVETFWPNSNRVGCRYHGHAGHDDRLVLARRPIVLVPSVEENGVILDNDDDYAIEAGAGILLRLNGDSPGRWLRGSKIVVTYSAGWGTVPQDLKLAAEQLARGYWFEGTRDPALRQISVPGVIERQFWVGSASDPAVPQDVIDMLGPYRNILVG